MQSEVRKVALAGKDAYHDQSCDQQHFQDGDKHLEIASRPNADVVNCRENQDHGDGYKLTVVNLQEGSARPDMPRQDENGDSENREKSSQIGVKAGRESCDGSAF